MTADDGPRLLPAGPDALLVEVASTAAALELYAAVRSVAAPLRAAGSAEVVPGARTVLLDGVEDLDGLRRWLAGWRPGTTAPGRPDSPDRPDRSDLPGAAGPGVGGDTVEVPTTYDGADLEDVARRWQMTRREAVATHAGTTWTVAFSGFSPGFAYCVGLPAGLAVPRLVDPRPRVPAGSVAVADAFTGVYPTSSPGGWRLLGRTTMTLWDPQAAPPAVLVPGTRVRFVPVPPGGAPQRAQRERG